MAHTIGIGSVVKHTQFDSQPAVVLSEDGAYWELKEVESGKPHKWNQAYCVSVEEPEIHIGSYVENIGSAVNRGTRGYVVNDKPHAAIPMWDIHDKAVNGKQIGTWYKKSCRLVGHDKVLAVKPQHYNPCGEIPIGTPKGELNVISCGRQHDKSTAFAEAMKYSDHILATRYEQFNNTSEEDTTMKLLIQDKVTINGADSTGMTDDTLIQTIRDAEVQIEEYKAIKAKSNAITARITQLEDGVTRLVAILDKK